MKFYVTIDDAFSLNELNELQDAELEFLRDKMIHCKAQYVLCCYASEENDEIVIQDFDIYLDHQNKIVSIDVEHETLLSNSTALDAFRQAVCKAYSEYGINVCEELANRGNDLSEFTFKFQVERFNFKIIAIESDIVTLQVYSESLLDDEQSLAFLLDVNTATKTHEFVCCAESSVIIADSAEKAEAIHERVNTAFFQRFEQRLIEYVSAQIVDSFLALDAVALESVHFCDIDLLDL